MSHEPADDRLADELTTCEQVLRGFTPAATAIDRDQLMFRAGLAAASGEPASVATRAASGGPRAPATGRRERNFAAFGWPAATVALGATSLALAVALMVRPEPPVRIVYRERPAAAQPAAPVAVEAPAVEAPAVDPPAFQEPFIADARPSPVAPHALADETPRTASRRVAPPAAGDSNFLRTRDLALRMGLDALGSPRYGGSEATVPPTYLHLLTGLTGASPPSSAAPGEPPPTM